MNQNNDTNAGATQNVPESQRSVKIQIRQIVAEAETYGRVISDEVVNEYAELMKAGTIFPPVLVYRQGNKYYLADGFHRVVATLRAWRGTIQAHVRKGGRLDALEAALSINGTHGLRPSSADKKFAVDRALVEFPDRADRAIAVMCRVSPTFVGERRKLHSPPLNSRVDSSGQGK